MDIVLMIGLSISLNNKFKQNGKTGAAKYIVGIISSILIFEVIGIACIYGVESVALGFLFIIIGFIIAGVIYSAGKKEALKYDPNAVNQVSTYYNQPFNQTYPQGFQNQQQFPSAAPNGSVGAVNETFCKAYVDGKCYPYGNDSGYSCDFDPNNWQNCQVVRSNVATYGRW